MVDRDVSLQNGVGRTVHIPLPNRRSHIFPWESRKQRPSLFFQLEISSGTTGFWFQASRPTGQVRSYLEDPGMRAKARWRRSCVAVALIQSLARALPYAAGTAIKKKKKKKRQDGDYAGTSLSSLALGEGTTSPRVGTNPVPLARLPSALGLDPPLKCSPEMQQLC